MSNYIWTRGRQSFVPIEINTRCFGTKFFAATFKFGFASTKSTFEVTGCGLMAIGGERENTQPEVVAALVLTALPSGKDVFSDVLTAARLNFAEVGRSSTLL